MSFLILPLDIRSASERLPVSEWLSITTLCLAPLIVHIIAGIPDVVYLQPDLPRWHETICFYNPTTIIWRYLALTDRRVRSKEWNSVDMAASNVRFWTRSGWDGSEEMMVRSRVLCTKAPRKARMDFCSKVAAETAIVIVQGVQAIVDLTNHYDGGWVVSLATTFYTLALVGLLRLPAAYWISDEASYVDYHSQLRRKFASMDARSWEISRTGSSSQERTNGLDKPWPKTPSTLYPRNNWRGWLVRIFFLGVILVVAMGCTALITPWLPIQWWVGWVPMTLTAYVQTAVFSFLMTSMFAIISFYSLRKESTTTIVPCIQTLWYKIYTLVIYTAFLVVLAIAALETRKSPCGVYTTSGKVSVCARNSTPIFSASAMRMEPLGLIPFDEATADDFQVFQGLYSGTSQASNSTTLAMAPFTGICIGRYDGVGINFEFTPRLMDNSSDFARSFEMMPANNISNFELDRDTIIPLFGIPNGKSDPI